MLRLAHLHHDQGLQGRDPEALREAAHLYARIIQDYPRYERLDHAIFFLGFTLLSLDRDGDARRHLTTVLTDFPRSSYVPHAYLHLGESFFGEQDWKSAQPLYEKATSIDFEFHAFAVYKLAWTHQRAGDIAGAIDLMSQVVRQQEQARLAIAALEVVTYWSRERGLTLDPRLVNAARAAQAKVAVDRVGSPPGGSCEREIPHLSDTLRSDPLSAQAPAYQLAIVTCLVEVGRLGDARAELRRMSDLFGKDSAWRHASDKSQRRAAKQLTQQAKQIVRQAGA